MTYRSPSCVAVLCLVGASGAALAQEETASELISRILHVEIWRPEREAGESYDAVRDRLVSRPRSELEAIANDASQDFFVRWFARLALDRLDRPDLYASMGDFLVPADRTNRPASASIIGSNIVAGPTQDETQPERLMAWLELCVRPGWINVRLNAYRALIAMLGHIQRVRQMQRSRGLQWPTPFRELTPEERLDIIRIVAYSNELPSEGPSHRQADRPGAIASILRRLIQTESFAALGRLWRAWRPPDPEWPVFDLSNPALRSVGMNREWDTFLDQLAATPDSIPDGEYFAVVQDIRSQRAEIEARLREQLSRNRWLHLTDEQLVRHLLVPGETLEDTERRMRNMPRPVLEEIRPRLTGEFRELADKVLSEP